MSKKDKEKRKRRSVAAGSAKRRERAERGASDMFNLPKGAGTFAIESVGVKRIDIIPYTVGKGNPNFDEGTFGYERTFFAHRNIGVNNEMVVCPARTSKKPCPICEYRAKLAKDPEADEKVVKALEPSKRMLLNVRDMKKEPDVVKVWHVSNWYFGKALDEALSAAYEDHEDNMDNFCDPEGGHYLKIVAESGYEGQGYNVARVDFVPRKEDLSDEILEQAVCLDDVLVVKTYEELKEMFFVEKDEDEDDGKPTKKQKKTTKKHKDDDDEDEDLDDDKEDDESDSDSDDEDSDDDDADEDEKPKKKKKDEDSDDDDDDDDEDDEDEKPKKKVKKDKKKSDDEDDSDSDDDDWDDEDADSDSDDGDDDDKDEDDEKPKKKKK